MGSVHNASALCISTNNVNINEKIFPEDIFTEMFLNLYLWFVDEPFRLCLKYRYEGQKIIKDGTSVYIRIRMLEFD
jgi:hypothetical protein